MAVTPSGSTITKRTVGCGERQPFTPQTTLPSKDNSQKKLRRRPAFGQLLGLHVLRRSHGVGDHILEDREVLQEAFAAQVGELAKRLRPIVLEAFPDLHEAAFVEKL